MTISCTKSPVFQESLVPEIVSITSIPETNSVTLLSDLNAAPFGRVECGFYIGTDKTSLRRLSGTLTGKSIRLEVNNLYEGTTYYFKAFISNGINEIGSGFESFLTETETSDIPVLPEIPQVPEDPADPENPAEPEQPSDPQQPEVPGNNPGEPEEPQEPEEPDNPDVPQEPEIPEDPEVPAEFTVRITGLQADVSDYIAELTAYIEGDASLITDCWFMVGYTREDLSKIKGTKDGQSVKAYLAGLEPGTYHYKAVITNGHETIESDIQTFSF